MNVRSIAAVALLAALASRPRPARGAPPAASSTVAHTAVQQVEACLPLGAHRVALATRGGLVLAARSGAIIRRWTRLDGLPGTRIHALYREGNTLWAGTERGVVAWEIRATGDLERIKVLAGSAVRAFARHRGSLYAGSWGAGVLRIAHHHAPARARLVHLPAGGPQLARGHRRIDALASWGGRLVAATAGSGLLELRGGRMRRMRVTLPSDHVFSLVSVSPVDVERGAKPRGHAASRPQLMVGTLGGLVRIEPRSADRLAPLSVSTIDARALAWHRGTLWAGTYGQGLVRLIPSKNGWTRAARPQLPPRARYIDGLHIGATIGCVASRDGVWLRSAAKPSFRRLELRVGLPHNDIASLAAIGGELWAGTFDHGLARYRGGRWKRVYPERIDGRINALAAVTAAPNASSPDRTLWIGTARGLYRLRPGAPQPLTRFDRTGSLPSAQIHALAPLRSGGVVVGTGRGAALVVPKQPHRRTTAGSSIIPLGPKQGLPKAAVWAVAEGRDGALWLGTSSGLYRWDRRATGTSAGRARLQRFSVASGHLADDWVTAILVAPSTPGARKAAPAAGAATRAGRGSSELYVGTYNGGVSHLRCDADAGTCRATQLGGGWINLGGLYLRGDTLYAATMSGLRSRARSETRWRLHPSAAPGRDVTAIAPAPGDALWIASRRGIARLVFAAHE